MYKFQWNLQESAYYWLITKVSELWAQGQAGKVSHEKGLCISLFSHGILGTTNRRQGTAVIKGLPSCYD